MRRVLAALAGLLALGSAAPAAERFDFAALEARARERAARPYQPRVSPLPAALRALNYDQYRRINYRRDRAWWRAEGLPFQLQFAHPGFLFNETIHVSEVTPEGVRPIAFDPELFEYDGQRVLDGHDGDLGFAGLRVLHPLNDPGHFDELVVFQGASYFRGVGRGQAYGLSARGLALDSGGPRPEEFPAFEEFWVERPAPGAREIVVHALLDSPSVAGAYRFTVRPGLTTLMDVRATLYFRAGATADVVGLAPLTSMFWYGENSGTTHGDYRPEVHDSDGLAIARSNGEWLWRPLANPSSVQISDFVDEHPRGFGLLQRDRAYASYQDLEARYQLRPSAWVEPAGDWGRGQVRLVELPTPDETSDNIVAFWVPAERPAPGRPLELAYRLHWFREGRGPEAPGGRTVSTRIGRSLTHDPDWIRFAVDFEGGRLEELADSAEVEADLTVTGGAELRHRSAQKNPFTGGWRAAFAIRPDGSGRPVELRAYLREGGDALTETWLYRWTP